MKKIFFFLFCFLLISAIGNAEVSVNGREQVDAVLSDDSGNMVSVNADGQLHVVMEGTVDSNNSTTTTLAAGATFTGEATNILPYSAITLVVESDVASADNGFMVQFSANGTDWHDGEDYTIAAGTTKFFTPPVQLAYYRIVYTNGGSDQTSFHLHSVLKKSAIKWSSHNLTDNLDDGDDATLNLSVLKLRTAQDNYVTGSATSGGNFKVSLEEFESGVSSNSNSQLNVTPFCSDGTEGVDLVDCASGFSSTIDALGSLKVFETTTLVGASFEGKIVDTNFWTPTVLNGATVEQDGELFLETNTTANGELTISSVRSARKIPGIVNEFRAVGHCVTESDPDNIKEFGIFDNQNGAFFKVDGTTLKVVTRNGGVDTEVSSGSFNGDVASKDPDTDIHRFVINYTAYAVKFWCDGVLLHTVLSTGEPWTKSLSLPIRAHMKNINGNTTDNKMHFQLLTIVRLGRLQTEAISKYQSGTTAGIILKYGAGELSRAVISGVANNSVITLYDNTAASGTVLWSSGAMGSQTQPFSLDFGDLPFSTGLTLAITGASSNITVVYE